MKLKELMDGLAIILRNQPEAEIEFSSETVYAGDYCGPIDGKDEMELVKLGWFDSEDSWALLL